VDRPGVRQILVWSTGRKVVAVIRHEQTDIVRRFYIQKYASVLHLENADLDLTIDQDLFSDVSPDSGHRGAFVNVIR
jgi:hypothetical protein